MNAAIQTSALTRQRLSLDVELSGMLTTNAEVRTRIEADGRTSVILHLQLQHQHSNELRNFIIDKTFNEMQRAEAEQEAKQLIKGRFITFKSKTDAMRMFFPNVSNITVL